MKIILGVVLLVVLGSVILKGDLMNKEISSQNDNCQIELTPEQKEREDYRRRLFYAIYVLEMKCHTPKERSLLAENYLPWH